MTGFTKTPEGYDFATTYTAAFRARGKNFMQMHSVVHEALVKEAIVTGVEATMRNFGRMEMLTLNTNVLIETYRERAKRF
jgi:hypothetical protein